MISEWVYHHLQHLYEKESVCMRLQLTHRISSTSQLVSEEEVCNDCFHSKNCLKLLKPLAYLNIWEMRINQKEDFAVLIKLLLLNLNRTSPQNVGSLNRVICALITLMITSHHHALLLTRSAQAESGSGFAALRPLCLLVPFSVHGALAWLERHGGWLTSYTQQTL